MTYSLVIPLKNEAESLLPLYKELKNAISSLKKEYEIIFVDDGSTDNSYEVLKSLENKDRNIKVIKLRANFGKSYALDKGLEKSQGEIVITLDADLQDDPAEIPKLISKLNEGFDFVNGWRKKRQDNFTKKFSSNLFNLGTSFIAGIRLHDFNCGLKAFTKEVADELYLRGELHRFIPVLAYKNKFKVTEIAVNHRPRRFGESKFGRLGIKRGWKGVVDLLTAIFITDYSTKPGHFFGFAGILFFSIGFIMDFYVLYIKILTGTTQGKLPLLIAGVLFLLLGVQLISTGLIAEMIVSLSQRNKK